MLGWLIAGVIAVANLLLIVAAEGAKRALQDWGASYSRRSLVDLDEQDCLAGQHEEVLLRGLAVVEPARLPRPEHRERHAELRPRRRVRLPDARRGEPVALEPHRVARVQDEPPVRGRRE